MRNLLDADWLISFLNGRADAVELLEKLVEDDVSVSTITCGEILEGLLSAPSRLRHAGEFEAFIQTVHLVSPDMHVARHYAKIRSHLRSQGLPIPDNDLWIAASALAFDLTLVSRDQHFVRIPNLKLYQQGEHQD